LSLDNYENRENENSIQLENKEEKINLEDVKKERDFLSLYTLKNNYAERLKKLLNIHHDKDSSVKNKDVDKKNHLKKLKIIKLNIC